MCDSQPLCLASSLRRASSPTVSTAFVWLPRCRAHGPLSNSGRLRGTRVGKPAALQVPCNHGNGGQWEVRAARGGGAYSARGWSGGVAGGNRLDLGVVCESFKSGWGLWQSAVRRTPTRLSPAPRGFDDIFFGTGNCFACKL